MTALVAYDAMCAAIETAYYLDEVKDLHNQAATLEAYAKQAKNLEAERYAREIRLRAKHRLGEIMKAQKKVKGLKQGRPASSKIGSKMDPIKKAITLAEAGIDKHLADEARKLAALPKEEFEKKVKEPKPPRKPPQPKMKPVPENMRSRICDDRPTTDVPAARRNSAACAAIKVIVPAPKNATKEVVYTVVEPAPNVDVAPDHTNPNLVFWHIAKLFIALGTFHDFLTGVDITQLKYATGVEAGFEVARIILAAQQEPNHTPSKSPKKIEFQRG